MAIRMKWKISFCVVLMVFCVGLSPAVTVIRWGSPEGETDIVTAQTNGSAMSLTYSETSAINPVQGTSYYPNAAGRNPAFYGSHSTYNNGAGTARWAEIHDSATTQDDIWINGYVEPLTSFQGMVTWLKADFLAPPDVIDSFTISIRKRNSTDTSTFRWLIKKDGKYYISVQTQSVSSTNFTNYSVNASSLTWKEFTPFGWNGNTPGIATIGATVVTLTLDNVAAVGYYYDTTNGNTTTSRWCGSIVKHFEVNAISYKASLPSPSDGESVTAAPILSWTAGDFAQAHDIYFDTANPPATYMGRQTENSFNPNLNLTRGQYFWRIDEVKDLNIAVGDPGNVWKGDVWSFVVSTTTNWTNADPGSNFWTNEANWDNGVPGVGSSANIHMNGPALIDSSVEAVATGTWCRWGIPDTDPNTDTDAIVLNMSGGSLTVKSWALGNGGPAIVNVSGGTISTSGNLVMGDEDSCDSTLNMNGGTVNIEGVLSSKVNATTNFVNLNGGVLTASGIALNPGIDPDHLGSIVNLAGGALILDGDKIDSIVSYVVDGRIIAYDNTSQVIVDYNDTNPGKTTVTGFKLNSEHGDFTNDFYADMDDLAVLAQEWLFQAPTQFAWSFDMAADPVGSGEFELEIREPVANNNHYIMGDDTGSGTLEVTGEGILLLDSHIPDAVGLFDTTIHYVVKTTSSNPLNLWYTMGTSANPGKQAYVGISTSLSSGVQAVEIWTGRPPGITGYAPVTVTDFSESAYLDITVEYDYESDTFNYTVTDGTITHSGTNVYTYFNDGDGGEFTLQGKNGATGFVDQLDVTIHGANVGNAVSDTHPDNSVDLKDYSVLAKEWLLNGYPVFSWNRVPLYAHFGIGDGLSSDQYAFLADHHFSLITITNGILSHGSSEPNIGTAARAIKQNDPNTKVLFYWASDMPKHQQKLSNATFPEDGFLPDTNYFDVTRQDVRNWYSNVSAAAVQAYSCDGIFADGALRWFNRNDLDMDAGMMSMMEESKQKMGPDGIIIYNGLQVEGSEQYFQVTDGAMNDDFLRSENINPMTKETIVSRIEKMRQTSQDGEITVFKAWPGFCWWSDPNMMEQPHEVIYEVAKEYITFPLACFLVGAGENCYFGYSWGWLPEYGWFDWYPEFDKPLGPPLGDAIRNGWTYQREFEHASVFVDIENRTAQIDWREP
ncbi:MAG: putative glycoside hydrolase family 15 protein [Phycisphaerae bacterium]|nr:putative glycoside hydrolase family 15 protein [Phycisphaerae bacterium]